MKWLDGRRGFGMLCGFRYAQTAVSELTGGNVASTSLYILPHCPTFVCRITIALFCEVVMPLFDILQTQNSRAENRYVINV